MHYEIEISPGDPNEAGWLQKEADMNASEANWHRLATIVLADAVHESGVYDELSTRQRSRIDRNLEIALDPETPRTRSELKAATRGHQSGFPLWSIPILLGVAAAAPVIESIEDYGKSGRFGSHIIAQRTEARDKRRALDMLITGRDAHVHSLMSSLYPERQVALRAMRMSAEPADYVVDVRELLDAAETASKQDNSNEQFTKWWDDAVEPLLNPDKAPRPLSRQDQRARAAEIVQGSSLLQNGELCEIKLERRTELLPDGPKTLRVHASLPYQYLYEHNPPAQEAYEDPIPWFVEDFEGPHPIDELLTQSRR